MQLIYRGIPYTAAKNIPAQVPAQIPAQVPETVEGKYHGIKIQISLPQAVQGIDDKLRLMRYRGVRLATR